MTLGPLLDIEENLKTPLLNTPQRGQAQEIKDAGNDGAHKRVELNPDSVNTHIPNTALIAATIVHKAK